MARIKTQVSPAGIDDYSGDEEDDTKHHKGHL